MGFWAGSAVIFPNRKGVACVSTKLRAWLADTCYLYLVAAVLTAPHQAKVPFLSHQSLLEFVSSDRVVVADLKKPNQSETE